MGSLGNFERIKKGVVMKGKSGGIGLFGIVFIILLVFKLAGVGAVANWAWVWVFAPLWIPVACVGAVLLLLILLALLVGNK